MKDNLFHQGLCLPSGPCVSDEDVKYIVDSIGLVLGDRK